MKKSIETKQLLITTVKNLLCHTADIRVKDITDTAFVNIAAVNYHFDDKDKLVEVAMNEIFVDFKYEINKFKASDFTSTDKAARGFIDMILQFVTSHIGFFRRIANAGKQGIEYFKEEEFLSISSRQLLSLGINKSGEELSAVFGGVLAQIVFAVLYYPHELDKDCESEFMKTYFSQIKNTLTGDL